MCNKTLFSQLVAVLVMSQIHCDVGSFLVNMFPILLGGCLKVLKVLTGICGEKFRKLLSFTWSILWWGREEMHTFGKITGWGRVLFVSCLFDCIICHLLKIISLLIVYVV